MILHVIEAKYLDHYCLWLAFNNGASGEIDLEAELKGSVFSPLKDKELFAKMILDPELGTISWPNGADLAPEFLFEKLSKK